MDHLTHLMMADWIPAETPSGIVGSPQNKMEGYSMEKQFFKDFYGNTASITNTGCSFVLICRNYYGKQWKRGEYATAMDAKSALTRTGENWHTTKGFVADN